MPLFLLFCCGFKSLFYGGHLPQGFLVLVPCVIQGGQGFLVLVPVGYGQKAEDGSYQIAQDNLEAVENFNRDLQSVLTSEVTPPGL